MGRLGLGFWVCDECHFSAGKAGKWILEQKDGVDGITDIWLWRDALQF